MLYRFEQLNGLPIEATDGELGRIKDIYFDDHRWAVRYLVVQTTGWSTGREVLISPISVKSLDLENNVARVELTQQQVRASPDIDTDKPVSRQHERDFFNYYGYPYYWNGPGLWGTASDPVSHVPWPFTSLHCCRAGRSRRRAGCRPRRPPVNLPLHARLRKELSSQSLWA